jgi:cytosine permease
MNRTSSSQELPAYITNATPNPPGKRAPWYKNTAPTYAGIFLWFVFWQSILTTQTGALGGSLSQGIGVALLAIAIAGLVCHYLFFYIPGLFGMKTGLPLYVIGTSALGAKGGFIMPGFLMGLLQFGWIAVQTYTSSIALSGVIPIPPRVLMVIFGYLVAFLGLKGIRYVSKVSTYIPLIPLVTLVWMFGKTVGGLGSFDAAKLIEHHQALAPNAPSPLGFFGVIAAVLTYVVGYFATAGAAGVDFGLNNRDKRDVSLGGLTGIALATLVTGGLSALIVAGAYGSATIAQGTLAAGAASNGFILDSVSVIPVVLGPEVARWIVFLLAIAALPAACFSAFIGANSFRTTLSSVNPYISVGLGATASIILAVTGMVSQVIPVFVIVGASFAPICGAMLMDYLLSGGKWTGPRAGFNPAGWIAWALGFTVGILPNLGVNCPAAPVLAAVVAAAAYFICAKLGLQTRVIPLNTVYKPKPAGSN